MDLECSSRTTGTVGIAKIAKIANIANIKVLGYCRVAELPPNFGNLGNVGNVGNDEETAAGSTVSATCPGSRPITAFAWPAVPDDRAAGTCVVLEKSATAADEFGSLMQRCRAGFLAGKTIRLEGELRSKNVARWAGLWLRADSEAMPNLFFDNMSRRPVIGTTDWQRCSIDAPLPRETEWLNYGIVLAGPGALYADNLRLLCWSQGRWEDV